MPLPPKPKRPLGPPVLFHWQGEPIRTRADIEAGGRTWHEFLDAFAAIDILELGFEATEQVVKLVPPSERLALSREIRRVRLEHLRRRTERENELRRRLQEAVRPSWFRRVLRRA